MYMNIRYNLQSVVMRGTQSGGVAMSSHQSHTHVHMSHLYAQIHMVIKGMKGDYWTN